MRGEVVKLKTSGKPFDHVTEVREALQGVKNEIEALKQQLSRYLDAATKEALTKQLDKLKSLNDRVMKVLFQPKD